MEKEIIKPHNAKAAAVWDKGGMNYDNISYSISDAIEHCIIRLAPKKEEKILDVATGTGWAALKIAERGARVTGIDFGKELIESARSKNHLNGHSPDFRIGDAEKMEFENESFDAVISTFGVMFVSNPESAAKELSRVCRKNGRIALTTWLPDSTIFGMFKVMKKYMNVPPNPPPSPFEWGSSERVNELLGDAFELKFEYGTTVMRVPGGNDAWELFVNSYGPTKNLAESLDDNQRENLKRDFIEYHERYKTDMGINMPRKYLVTIGVKK